MFASDELAPRPHQGAKQAIDSSLVRKSLQGLRLLLVLICAGSFTFAGEPILKELRPWGAQRGKPFQLTLVGSNLVQDSKIISTLPAAFTLLTPPRDEGEQAMGPKTDHELPFLVELEADASVGLYPIRVSTADGLSNVLLFSVGVFPEVTEAEAKQTVHRPMNDSPKESELIQKIPVTVNGTLYGPERDMYRIRAKKGQRLVFEVEARRAGSAVDPVIRLLDSLEKQIAINNDAPGLGLDCRLDVSFPTHGEYYLVVHDARFSKQEQNFYRLKIGSFAHVDGLFPLGWTRGDKAKVQLFGGNLAQPVEITVDLSKVDGKDDFTMVSVPGAAGSLPYVFAVSDLPEILEPAGRKVIPLEPSTVVNGRISKPQQVDRYHLAVNPGENWIIDVQAADLGTSRLSAVLTIYDEKEKRLASAGDEIPDRDVFSLISPGRTSSDPHITFEIPKGTHKVILTVEDLVGRGGPLYGYRLLARKQPPDFTLSLSTPYVNIPEGGTASVTLNTKRRGYIGSIQLGIQDAGDDLIVEGGVIPSELDDPDNRKVSRQGVLTITAKKGAKSRLSELSVWGKAVLEDGTVIRRRARGPGLITQILGGTGVSDPNRRDRQKPFVAPWLGLELPMMVAKKIPAKLLVDSPSQVRLVQGMEYDFRWRFRSDNPNVRPPKQVGITTPGARELRIKRDNIDRQYEKSGVLTLATTVGTPPIKFNVVLNGEVYIQGSKQKIYTPAITVEVVQGYKIVVPSAGVTVQPGGKAELVTKVQRDPAFHQPVEIRVENLPLGVSCLPTEVASTQEEFRVVCQVEPSAVPGEYNIELTSSSVLAGRDKEKVPYRIAPVEARLVVSELIQAER
ncbi:MAG: hypothetical protein ACE5MK_03320 [Acidobacteriota bacterium]